MMKISWLRVVGLAVCVSSVAVEAKEIDLLRYYCHEKGVEFARSSVMGNGVRVYAQQGGYQYVKAPYPVVPTEDFIKQHMMLDAKISPECTEFLMSKGVSEYGADGVLARVYFAFDSSELTEQSRYILDYILGNMSRAGNLVVEGHTDSIGSDSYNFSLGMKRASNVSDYLVKKGLPSTRVHAVSKGEKAPIADNQSASGRYLNRRVDISN